MMREIPRDLTEAERELYLAVKRGDLLETARILRQAREPLPQDLAAVCLTKGLFACPELFARLLEWCPEREYAGEVLVKIWPWRSPADAVDWKLQGTLVTLAAALNKTQHLQMLLERGMDVNSASLAAITALLTLDQARGCGYGESHGFPFPGKNAGIDSWLKVGSSYPSREISACLEICGVTPLAAAVTFGAVECVELLLKRPGIWLTECLSVSAALLLPFREWCDSYREACRLVRTHGMENGQERRLTLWAAAQNCTTQQLREELARHTYTEEELALAARCVSLEQYRGMFDSDGDSDQIDRIWGKLTLLEKCCPAAVHTPEISRKLLELVLLYDERTHRSALLALVVRSAQGTADISLAGNSLDVLNRAWLETVLQTLCKHGRCVMDRDAVLFGLNAKNLRVLLKYVEFLPPECREGISGLTCAILFSGDLRLIRKALEKGLIPGEESTEALLQFQKRMDINPAVRALLLCTPREKMGVPELPRLPGMTRRWHGAYRWFAGENALSGASNEEWKTRLLLPECAETLERYYVLLERTSCSVEASSTAFPLTEDKEPVLFEASSRPMVMCLLGRIRTALASLDGIIGLVDVESVRVRGSNGKETYLVLTPLCAAALAGQTELVHALLDRGLDANEYDRSRPCWVECNGTAIPLTPLLAALLSGHWDTGRLLVERGAVFDLREPLLTKLRTAWWTDIKPEDWQEHLSDLISSENVLRNPKES